MNDSGSVSISVLMAVHNGQSFLKESIESILRQTRRDFEFIIVDDGSTDSSAAVIAEYAARDSRVVVVTNPRALTLPGALNRGLEVARGKYIARHDDDDIAVADRLAIQYEYLEAHPEIFLCGGQAVAIDKDGERLHMVMTEVDEAQLKKTLEGGLNNVIHPSIMFRNTKSLRYRTAFVNAQDYDLYLRIYSQGLRIVNMPRILLFYRQNLWQTNIIRKVVRQRLLNRAARVFYAERLAGGGDSYEQYDFSSIREREIEKTADPEKLKIMLEYYFACGSGKLFRDVFARYRAQGHGGRMLWAKYLLSYFPSGVLKLLRRGIRGAKTAVQPRIALLATTGCGVATWNQIGSTERELGIYQRLFEHGWKTEFFTYDAAGTQLGAEFPGIELHPMRLVRRLPSRLYAWYGRCLPWLYGKIGKSIAVIVTNQAHGGTPAIAMGRRWHCPVLARCGYLAGRNAVLRHERSTRSGRGFLRRERYTLDRAQRCFLTTAELLDWAVENYGIPRSKMRLVPNYIDLDVFAPRPAAEKDIDVICVGRLSGEKNYRLLLDAAAGTNWRIVIIGSGNPAELAAYAREKKVQVEFIAKVPNRELPLFLNRSRVYVICSHYEGHPKALAEAMACGCACVGTRTAGIANQIADGETGILCASDAPALRLAVERVLADDAAARRLGVQAREYARKNFDFDMICGLYEASLIELMQQKY